MRVSGEDAHCRIEIVDDGPGFSRHQGAGRSMTLVRARLECIYRGGHELRLERDAAAEKTIVVLRLPLMMPRGAQETPPVPARLAASPLPAVGGRA